MPHRCAFGCNATDVVMHMFPNPNKFSERFKAWVSLVGGDLQMLSDNEIYKNKRICDIHFSDNHRNRFKRLSALAVPSLLLPRTSNAHQAETGSADQITVALESGSTDQPSVPHADDGQSSKAWVLAEHNYTRPGPSQKRDSISYAAAFRSNDLCVAVMVEPYHDMTAEQAAELRERMETRFVDELLEPTTSLQTSKVHFRGKAHFSEGVLKLWCEDDFTLAWLRHTVDNQVSPFPGTKLVVKRQAEIQRKILCGLFLPTPNILDTDKLRKILAAQNPDLNVNSWTLVKAEKQVEKEKPGVHLLIRVPEQDVEKSKTKERRLYWLFGNIYLKVLEVDRTDRKQKSAVPHTTPTSDPVKPPPEEPSAMVIPIEAPSTPQTEEECFFLDVEGSDASESCPNSSPIKHS